MTEFQRKIFVVVSNIPRGKLMTYGDIANAIGQHGSARAVGNALHTNVDSENIPCHRVVNSTGRLASAYVFGGIDVQSRRLIKEGIIVESGRVVNLNRYRHQYS